MYPAVVCVVMMLLMAGLTAFENATKRDNKLNVCLLVDWWFAGWSACYALSVEQPEQLPVFRSYLNGSSVSAHADEGCRDNQEKH